MNKQELEVMLSELDAALVKAFPGPDPIEMLVVGGACLLFAGVSTRPTEDIDVIITDFLGVGSVSLVYNPDKDEMKLRKIIAKIGRSRGFKGDKAMFLNDDCAPFLVEMGNIPPVRLWRSYQKMRIYLPADLSYILACKLVAARPRKDHGDIAVLRDFLGVTSRSQGEAIIDQFFPNRHLLEETYDISSNLDEIFSEE
ncbi:MAG: hypothetical protein AUG51_22175 [Acidobacteria bacterium 13_1_20CM_3_53_8]|nr:MAG: hypothetical protein AUG51_22175 [Acidobacteria bacterium 13_1_20CM_3_53_8]